jgi:hypothetical protein
MVSFSLVFINSLLLSCLITSPYFYFMFVSYFDLFALGISEIYGNALPAANLLVGILNRVGAILYCIIVHARCYSEFTCLSLFWITGLLLLLIVLVARFLCWSILYCTGFVLFFIVCARSCSVQSMLAPTILNCFGLIMFLTDLGAHCCCSVVYLRDRSCSILYFLDNTRCLSILI